MGTVQPILVVLACFCGLMAALAVAAAAYCAVQVRPLAVLDRDSRISAIEAAFPAFEQRVETMRDAAAADLEEAQRQRQRAQNTRNRDGRTNQPQAPATRAEVIDMVRQRYQR